MIKQLSFEVDYGHIDDHDLEKIGKLLNQGYHALPPISSQDGKIVTMIFHKSPRGEIRTDNDPMVNQFLP
jgi:hypothetical protein